GTSSITITGGSVVGSGLSTTGMSAGLVVPAGQSVTMGVVYTPVSTAPLAGTITLSSTASDPTIVINVTGTSTGTNSSLNASTGPITFSSVTVGSTSASTPVTLSNSGTSSITITGGSISAGFSTAGVSAGQVIPAGQSIVIGVLFAPTSAGPANGSLTLSST